jgi:hypothetical protein
MANAELSQPLVGPRAPAAAMPLVAPALPEPDAQRLSLAELALAAITARHVPDALAGGGLEADVLGAALARCEPRSPDAALLAALLDAPAASDAALVGLVEPLGLSPLEVLCAALALAVEEDALTGRVVAHLQRPLGGSRPTLGLLASSLGPLSGDSRPLHALVGGAAVATGLLARGNEAAPLPEQTLRMPIPLVLALRGLAGGMARELEDGAEGASVPLPPSLLAEVAAQGQALVGERVLVVRTGCLPEGRTVARAVAAATGSRAAFLSGDEPAGLGPWLLLRRAMPVLELALAPGERRSLPAIAGYRGPQLVLCGPDGSVESVGRPALNWSLPVPLPQEREALWRQALGGGGPVEALARQLARDHRHGSGRIAQLAQLSQHQGQRQGRDAPSASDVLEAARGGEGLGLDALAQLVAEPVPANALVLSDAVRGDLELLLLRCRGRDQLVEHLGAASRTRFHPGVKALLVGASGTGKTLAAGWLAGRLGLPLYRVDLASITSKYIGETEKNLADLLARAEQAEVILLFDEADSLFGKRTEVKEANDRFANAQTNYLLQRIESYDGIVLLTSNSRDRFDSAFSRRLDAIVDFALPGPEERHALWRAHLGEGHGLSAAQLNRLAGAVDLPGGAIRNAVFAAAVLAREAGHAITMVELRRALAAEFRKWSQPLPPDLGQGD